MDFYVRGHEPRDKQSNEPSDLFIRAGNLPDPGRTLNPGLGLGCGFEGLRV